MNANIEELVKKHTCHDYLNLTPAYYLRNALTEQAETHAIELKAYDHMNQHLVREAEILNERIRQLEAERDGMALVPRGLLDKFPELNTSNYGHDDVDELNAWGIELVLAAAPQPKKESDNG